MATSLYETSLNARKIFIGVLVVIFLVLLWDTGSRFFQQAAQQATNEKFSFYIDPDNSLGNVPKMEIKSIAIDPSSTPTYSQDGIYGLFPDVAYVYSVDKPREKLTTIENAIQSASVLGFTAKCQSDQKPTDKDYCFISGDNYEWSSANRTKILKFNKSSQIWSMTTSFANNVEAKKKKTISLDINTYAPQVKNLISQMGFDTSLGLSDGQLTNSYADIGVDGTIFKPDQDSQAKYVFLNLYRQLDLADIKSPDQLSEVKDKSLIPQPSTGLVYNSNPNNGIFQILVSNDLSDYARDVYQLNFINFEYSKVGDTYTRGNYLIITPEEAWNKAQTGKGALVSIIPENRNPYASYANLSVRRFVADASKTELGYYEPEAWNGYVYPIYIFKGRAELTDGRQASFRIYVEAIKRVD